MLSIGRMSDAEYYLALAKEDYYRLGGEPPGLWAGGGSELLGLGWQVEEGDLRQLLQGYAPDGKPLIQNAGDPRHQAGWDLTFSAPKHVSVLWSVVSESTRRLIQQAQLAAVKAGIAYLERQAAFTRLGKGGIESERAKLIVACFEHGTSRAQDPQLHTHALVLNVCVTEDGKTRTLLSRPLYRHKMAAGAIYRAQLAVELQKLGFAIERDGAFFNIPGVPEELVEFFSKRRAEIEAALLKSGLRSQKAAEVAARVTRDRKKEVPRIELLELWKEAAAAYGFTEATAEELRKDMLAKGDAQQAIEIARQAKEAARKAIQEITTQQSYFAAAELMRRVASEGLSNEWDATIIETAVEEELDSSGDLICLGELDHQRHYATRQHFETEERLLADVQQLVQRASHVVPTATVAQAIERTTIQLGQRGCELSEEQVEAIEHLTLAPADIGVVNGMPGTGKTTMLNTCRDAWEEEGFRVIGCTLSAQAARELHAGSGIESYTIAKITYEWEKLAKQQITQEGTPSKPVPLEETRTQHPFALDAKTILVVDESSMADTPKLAEILHQVEQSGAKLVLVGDTRQLSAIGPGGAFAHIVADVGCVEMQTVTRQKHYRDIEAIHYLSKGEASKALDSYALRNMLVIGDSKEDAMRRLVDDWALTAMHRPQDSVIIASTRREVHSLNELCQAKRLESEPQPRDRFVEVEHNSHSEKIYCGDRVVLRENNRYYGVLNGDLGQVTHLDPKTSTLSVLLDAKGDQEQKTVVIPLQDYPQVQLGYAQTTHSKQGATLDSVFVLVGGPMQDKEITFVQASRHRHEVKLYTDLFEAGRDLEGLAEQMSRSHAKTMAHDIVQQIEADREGGEAFSQEVAPQGDASKPSPHESLTSIDAELELIHERLELDARRGSLPETNHYFPQLERTPLAQELDGGSQQQLPDDEQERQRQLHEQAEIERQLRLNQERSQPTDHNQQQSYDSR